MGTPVKILPMHIAFGVPNLAAGGGVEPVVMRLARGLTDRGHRVDIVMLSPQIGYSESFPLSVRLCVLDRSSDQAKCLLPVEFQGNFSPLDTESPAWTVRWKIGLKILKIYNWNPLAMYLFGDVRSTIASLAYIRQKQPDCILPSIPPSKNAMLLAARLAPNSPPVVPIVHFKLRPYLKARAKHWLLFPHADHLVAVSQGVAAEVVDVLGIHKSKVSAIYNPVHSAEMSNLALSSSPAHPWMHDDGPPVVLAAGRFSKDKDFPTLFRAFRRLSERRSVRLLILGEGRWRKRYEALIRRLDLNDSVSMPGRVDDPFAYMARAAVYVLSSRREGLPTVLIEALACGCPVVSTDCPYGPSEILEGGRWGELVPVGKDGELADAIERVLDNPLPREVLRRRAEFFSVDRAIDQYEKLIAEVVGNARS